MNSSFDNRLIALSHPVRRQIIESMSIRDQRVTEIAENFTISLNSVSKHIRMLERADIVKRKIVGRDHFLRLNPLAFDEIKNWLEKNTAIWKCRLEAIDEMLSNEEVKSKKMQNKKRQK